LPAPRPRMQGVATPSMPCTSSRSDNIAGGAVPRQPRGRKGLGATCFVPAPRKGAHPVVVAAPRILGSDPGRALGALLPGPERIREGATTPCREHGEERRQRSRPAQGQPRGPPRLGRPALLGLVADGTTSPPRPASRCIPRRGRRAGDPPSGQTPTPKPLARGPCEFLNSLLKDGEGGFESFKLGEAQDSGGQLAQQTRTVATHPELHGGRQSGA